MTTTTDAAAKCSGDMCAGRMKMVKVRMREVDFIWLCQQGLERKIVHLSSRMRDFFSFQMNELVSRQCQSVQLFIHYVHAISLQTTTRNRIWTKLRMGTGIWYTPLQDRLIILLLSYISTRTGAQIVQLLNNSDTLF